MQKISTGKICRIQNHYFPNDQASIDTKLCLGRRATKNERVMF